MRSRRNRSRNFRNFHFFFQGAFAWMALEGIHLYLSLNRVFNVDNTEKIGYYYGFGYALPLLIVGITSLVEYKNYGDPDQGHCWIKADKFMVWSFAGPVILVVTVNATFLVTALRVVHEHRKDWNFYFMISPHFKN